MELVAAISNSIKPLWAEEILSSYENDTQTQQILTRTLLSPGWDVKYSIQEGMLRYKGKLWVGNLNNIKLKTMEAIHNSTLGGHSGIQAFY